MPHSPERLSAHSGFANGERQVQSGGPYQATPLTGQSNASLPYPPSGIIECLVWRSKAWIERRVNPRQITLRDPDRFGVGHTLLGCNVRLTELIVHDDVDVVTEYVSRGHLADVEDGAEMLDVGVGSSTG